MQVGDVLLDGGVALAHEQDFLGQVVGGLRVGGIADFAVGTEPVGAVVRVVEEGEPLRQRLGIVLPRGVLGRGSDIDVTLPKDLEESLAGGGGQKTDRRVLGPFGPFSALPHPRGTLPNPSGE